MVAILFEGKSDGKFFDGILDAYNLPIDEVVYFDFEGKIIFQYWTIKYYDEIENDIILEEFTRILIVADGR